MGGWSIVVNCLFPIPLFALLILCLPIPEGLASPIRRGTNIILKSFLFNPFLGGFTIYQVSVTISTILFLEAAWQSSKSQEKLHALEKFSHTFDEHVLCLKWRNERNFWIAFMSLVLWLILHRVYKLTDNLEFYKTQLRAAEKPKDE